MTSVFSPEAVDLMESLGVDAYKIPSGEVTNLPLLDLIAATGKPVLLSSGMSDWRELDAAVNVILARHRHLRVLQCTSAYPCPYEQVGLNVMIEMRTALRRAGRPLRSHPHQLRLVRGRRSGRNRDREAFHA